MSIFLLLVYCLYCLFIIATLYLLLLQLCFLNKFFLRCWKTDNDTIEFSDFLLMMEEQMKNRISEKDVKNAFLAMSSDGKPAISGAALLSILTSTTEKLTDEEIDYFFKKSGIKNDGTVKYEGDCYDI